MKILCFCLLFSFLLGCGSLSHSSVTNVEKNKFLAARIAPVELFTLLQETSLSMGSGQATVETIKPLMVTLAGFMGSGIQELTMDPADQASKWSAAEFGPFKGIWLNREVLAQQPREVSVLNIGHEVGHSTDPRFGSLWSCFCSSLAKEGVETNIPIEMYAEYKSMLMLYSINLHLAKNGLLWGVNLLRRPGSAWGDNANPDGIVSENSPVAACKSWAELVSLVTKSADAIGQPHQACYLLANMAQVIMEGAVEGPAYAFEDSEYNEFIKTCDWGELAARVDGILQKYSIKECQTRFLGKRMALIKMLEEAAASNKKW